jgi:deoxyhypusine monooxygenase
MMSIAVGSPSVLLGHEIAFVLGQIQNPYAVPFLTQTLENRDINPIVRHEVCSPPL